MTAGSAGEADASGAARITALTGGMDRLGANTARSLAEAFETEPNFSYMLPREEKRRGTLEWFFGSLVLGLGLRHGSVDVTRGGSGAAVWIAPGEVPSPAGVLGWGILGMPVRFGFRGTARSALLSRAVARARARLAPGRHWYLMALGVSSGEQGRGLGSALLRHGLDRAAGSAAPVYLETFRERTAAFYRRHGFRRVGGGTVGRAGPTFHCMIRD